MHSHTNNEDGTRLQADTDDTVYDPEPGYEKEEPEGEQSIQYSGHIIIRLNKPQNADFAIPVSNSLREEAARLDISQLVELLDAQGLDGRRLIQSVSPQQVREFELPGWYTRKLEDRDTAQFRQQKLEVQPPSLNLYWRIDTRSMSEEEIEALMEQLGSLRSDGGIDLAYREVQVELAVVQPADDTEVSKQLYINAAPEGIDAQAAWGRFPGTGLPNNVGFADIEEDWRLDHADFNALLRNVVLVAGQRGTKASARTHGTSTLGVVMAVDNAIGVVGIAPAMAPPQIYLASVYDGNDNNNVADAITAAVMNGIMQPGDVLLLEVTRSGRPTESDCADFTAIWQAVFLHDIIVIEAAGNGRVNLDNLYANLNCSGDNGPTDDSGAIIVGACRSAVKSCNGAQGHARWWEEDDDGNTFGSCYGNRIDCHAWGENVYTTRGNGGYGKFGGTSAASAIVAGVVILIQSLWKNAKGSPIMPDQMRTRLRNSDNGTAYCPDSTPREIKAMPSLAKLINDLKL